MGWSIEDIPDQNGKVAVITGANSGLGFEASRALARRGATVLMAVRDLVKGKTAAELIRSEVAAAEIEVRLLDLGSLTSVRSFVGATLAEHGTLDILVNNAGLMATPAATTTDGFETQVGTNHLGHFALTAGLMPALSRAPAGRVVTVTSVGRVLGRPLTDERVHLDGSYDAWRAYGDSKLANYQFGMELARRAAAVDAPVVSLVADPGLSHTNLQVATVRNAGGGRMAGLWRFLARTIGTAPAEGVLPILRAATDSASRNGQLYRPRWWIRGAPVAVEGVWRAASPEVERMWHTSEAATDARFSLGD